MSQILIFVFLAVALTLAGCISSGEQSRPDKAMMQTKMNEIAEKLINEDSAMNIAKSSMLCLKPLTKLSAGETHEVPRPSLDDILDKMDASPLAYCKVVFSSTVSSDKQKSMINASRVIIEIQDETIAMSQITWGQDLSPGIGRPPEILHYRLGRTNGNNDLAFNFVQERGKFDVVVQADKIKAMFGVILPTFIPDKLTKYADCFNMLDQKTINNLESTELADYIEGHFSSLFKNTLLATKAPFSSNEPYPFKEGRNESSGKEKMFRANSDKVRHETQIFTYESGTLYKLQVVSYWSNRKSALLNQSLWEVTFSTKEGSKRKEDG